MKKLGKTPILMMKPDSTESTLVYVNLYQARRGAFFNGPDGRRHYVTAFKSAVEHKTVHVKYFCVTEAEVSA